MSQWWERPDPERQVPKPAAWEPFFDYGRDEVVGETPMCPACNEPLYEYDHCVFCGQQILMDDKLAEFAKPPEVEHMDCFLCGGKGTVEFTRSKPNGHKHGQCNKCGMRFME